MFYFESLKIKTESFNSPYSLTLKLEGKGPHFITSNNSDWLNKLFLFTKNRSFYQQGNWLINDYDLVHMNKVTFNNFVQQNIAFCDDSLLINNKWSIAKIIKFYKVFYKVNQAKIDELLSLLELNNLDMNSKIKDLNALAHLKLKLFLTSLKESEFVIVNFISYQNLNAETCSQITSLLNKLATKFKSEYIIFVNNELNVPNKINLDSKEYLFFNKTLTIGNTHFARQPINKFLNFWNITWGLIKVLWLDLLFIFIVDFFIFGISIWMTVLDSSNIQGSGVIADFIRTNNSAWKVITYMLHLFSYGMIFLGWAIMRHKRKKYVAFLLSNNYNSFLVACIWPIVFYITTFFAILFAFLISMSTTTSSAQVSLNELKYQLAIFLYILYMTIFAVALSLQVNQSIKPNSFKQTFIKIITS